MLVHQQAAHKLMSRQTAAEHLVWTLRRRCEVREIKGATDENIGILSKGLS
jgi:hypothetical protein